MRYLTFIVPGIRRGGRHEPHLILKSHGLSIPHFTVDEAEDWERYNYFQYSLFKKTYKYREYLRNVFSFLISEFLIITSISPVLLSSPLSAQHLASGMFNLI